MSDPRDAIRPCRTSTPEERARFFAVAARMEAVLDAYGPPPVADVRALARDVWKQAEAMGGADLFLNTVGQDPDFARSPEVIAFIQRLRTYIPYPLPKTAKED